MHYLLSAAVITGPGEYRYDLVELEHAQTWLQAHQWESMIGYPDTAQALQQLVNMPIPVNRGTCRLEIGEEALVFRLDLQRMGTRLPPRDKGKLPVGYIKEHYEIGVLRRMR